jgi:hypothetical protein
MDEEQDTWQTEAESDLHTAMREDRGDPKACKFCGHLDCEGDCDPEDWGEEFHPEDHPDEWEAVPARMCGCEDYPCCGHQDVIHVRR